MRNPIENSATRLTITGRPTGGLSHGLSHRLPKTEPPRTLPLARAGSQRDGRDLAAAAPRRHPNGTRRHHPERPPGRVLELLSAVPQAVAVAAPAEAQDASRLADPVGWVAAPPRDATRAEGWEP